MPATYVAIKRCTDTASKNTRNLFTENRIVVQGDTVDIMEIIAITENIVLDKNKEAKFHFLIMQIFIK